MYRRAQLERYLWDAALNPESQAAADFFDRETRDIDRIKYIRDLARQMRDAGIRVTEAVTYRITPEQYAEFIRHLRDIAAAKGLVKSEADLEQLALRDSWISRRGNRRPR